VTFLWPDRDCGTPVRTISPAAGFCGRWMAKGQAKDRPRAGQGQAEAGPWSNKVLQRSGDVVSSDSSIHHQIADLVSRERALREQLQAGTISADEEHQQLRELEDSLDQCWDLLRQRDALRAAGRDPGSANVRPVQQVENYEG
jgi:hypothetical protein